MLPATDRFKYIDTRLNTYYKWHGRQDYFDNTGVGPFLRYCLQNEYESDDIADELASDNEEDCGYIEFDPNFPFDKRVKGDEAKKKKIFSILHHIYKTGKAPYYMSPERAKRFVLQIGPTSCDHHSSSDNDNDNDNNNNNNNNNSKQKPSKHIIKERDRSQFAPNNNNNNNNNPFGLHPINVQSMNNSNLHPVVAAMMHNNGFMMQQQQYNNLGCYQQLLLAGYDEIAAKEASLKYTNFETAKQWLHAKAYKKMDPIKSNTISTQKQKQNKYTDHHGDVYTLSYDIDDTDAVNDANNIKVDINTDDHDDDDDKSNDVNNDANNDDNDSDSASDLELDRIVSIDKSLGMYYASMGRNDYFDSNNNGKFLLWCEDEGYSISGIDDELGDNADAADCSVIGLDDNFPLNKYVQNQTNTQKEEEIFRILQYCYKYNAPPSSPSNKYNINKMRLIPHQHNIRTLMDINELKWDINYYEIEQTKKKYSSQCDIMFSALAHGDDTFCFSLTLGLVNNNIPLLKNLNDIYMRDRLKHYILYKQGFNRNILRKAITQQSRYGSQFTASPSDLRVCDWKLSNPFCVRVTNCIGLSVANKLTSGIKSYIRRISPKFIFNPHAKIRDDIYCISEYLTYATYLIHYILSSPSASPPFQFDFGIAVRSSEMLLNDNDIVIPQFDNDLDGDKPQPQLCSDDDEHPNSPNDLFEKPFNKRAQIPYYDILGDIQGKLRNNKCKFYSYKYKYPDNSDDNNSFNIPQRHLLPHIYKEWKNKYKLSDNYPFKKRFCMILDRRNFIKDTQIHTDSTNKCDNIIIYSPPSSSSTIPSNNIYNNKHVYEWYHNSLRKCLIPRKNYKNGFKQKEIETQKPQETFKKYQFRRTITSDIAVNGGLLIFSFHCESEDEISCYLWWNCQCIRFIPSDIIDLLPKIFDPKWINPKTKIQNNKFKNDKIAKQFVNEFCIKDIPFERFWIKTGNDINDLRKYQI